MICIGAGAGAVGSITGVGGGVMITPALTFIGFTPAHAASTGLIAVTSTSASSTIAYSKQKRIDYAIGLKMVALSIPGAIQEHYSQMKFRMKISKHTSLLY